MKVKMCDRPVVGHFAISLKFFYRILILERVYRERPERQRSLPDQFEAS